jgi:predicted NUDIX family NTP pyrophosphohydrolase
VLLACVGVALTLGLVASFAGSAPSFAGPRFYGTAGFTYSVAIGDLNGDGKPDLATANSHQYFPSVSVLLNRGNGRFRARVDYEAGGGRYGTPYSVAIGDLNGDGKPDLATANLEDAKTVSVFLNKGNGTFRAKRDYGTGGAWSIAIGDLNGDGKPDLAILTGANTVSVFLNRGDGSFPAKVDYGTGRGPDSVAIGDLNGDGRPDLATANHVVSTASVLLNRGDGSFQAKVDYGTGRGPDSIAIGDLNGDGKPDLASANCGLPSGNGPCRESPHTVSVLLNSGDGSFQAKIDYGTGRMPSSVAIGDLNGDGKPDLATANALYAGTVSVLLNSGDGSFLAKHDYEAGVGPTSVAIGDLSGDGKPELAVAIFGERPEFNSGVSVLANATGFCGVPEARWETLRAAKREIARADCRVGRISRSYSFFKRGLVISQKPGPGAVLPIGGKVNLVLSRGRKR